MDGLTRKGFVNASAASRVTAGDSAADKLREKIQNNWYLPVEDLDEDEIRISFMGTNFAGRPGQSMSSVFVETGNGDSFVFDCGCGVISRYTAMGVPSSRMTKVFLTHLHGDHMSDLVTLYCFGPAHDRKTPLHVYGPSGPILDDVEYPGQGTNAFCESLYRMCAWHRESMSFLNTGLKDGQDGYQLVPHELPYREVGTAYHVPGPGGVKITHFPAAHDRDGSISYKLEYKGMKVVFGGDTKPTRWMLKHGKGVDVLIHEMALSVETWVNHMAGLYKGDLGYREAYAEMQSVQDNSHTPEEQLGKIFARCKPKLAVVTHCHFNQDTFIEGVDGVRKHYRGPLAWATDLVVLNVKPGGDIKQRMAVVPDYSWDITSKSYLPRELADPKYDGPYAQFSDFTMRHILPGSKP
jgi:ribonuclease Z